MRKFYVLLFTVFFAATVNAQISNYLFSQNNGSYTPLVGGTVIITATDPLPSGVDQDCMDDFTYAEIPLPFSFYFGGSNQTSFRVNSNGWLGFGTGNTTNSTAPISSTLPFNGIIAPCALDLMGLGSTSGTITSGSNVITAVANTGLCVVGKPITGTGIPAGTTITSFTANTITLSANATSTTAATFISWCTGEIRYDVLGSAPNRTFVVQFTGLSQYSTATSSVGLTSAINYQIRLSEGGGIASNQTVSIVFGPAQHPGTATTGQVGLRGTVNTDYNDRTTTTDWTTTTAGASNSATVTWGPSINPTSGLTFVWTPPPPCAIPADQPTTLVLTPTISSVSGTFTAAASTPSGYLVIRTLTSAPPSNPVDGTTYTAGTSALGGIVVSSGASTSFVASGLSQSTTYYFWVYSFNNSGCAGGPVYRSVAPLTQSATTTACSLSGTKTVGPTGNYTSITAAIADINANGLAGALILELQPTYLSSVETFPIVINEIICGSNTLTIRPQSGSVGLSITSASSTGTIQFNGGDYVTIDGRAGGTGPSQLTISNTSTSGYAIQFINSAMFNTIKYCTISGVNSSTSNGVIAFSTATGLSTGNSNNTIDNCDIKDGATTPTNLIYCSGSTVDYASQNNNNTVSNSNLHDWFNASSTTSGAAINIVGGASDWTITANSFYQSVARTFTMTSATDQGAVHIASATFGVNFTITNNFIGGSAPLCAGAPWTYTGGATGTPTPRLIRITTAVGAYSNISGNTISNFSFTTSSTSTAHSLISHLNGNVNINNNTLGSQSATGNISFVLASTSTSPFFLPISVGTGATPCAINITNNNIGGITVSTSSTGSVSFRIVYAQPVVGSTVTINNNLIGGTVANSIQQLTNNIMPGIMILNPTIGDVITNNTIRNLTQNNTGTTGSVTGINVQASGGQHTITGNSVFNLTTNGTNININNAASVVGITMTGSAVGGTNVSGNTIYNLSNTSTTAATWVNGMYFGTAVAPQPQTIVSKNFVHSISLSSNIAGTGMVGIFLPNTGNALVYNNMVRLGYDGTGASITTQSQINGIYKASTGSMGIYFNTVYIGGSGVASGAVNTYAYRRSSSGPADTLMNNIFFNARSNASGTGKHYAINTNANSALVSNFNDLLVSGTGGVLGVNAAIDYATLAAWQAGTGQDANSVGGDPVLINPTGTSSTVDLHITSGTPTPIERSGFNLPQVTDDIDGQTRASLTPVDIGADAGNFVFAGDVTGPVINYSAIATPSCGTGDRTLSNVNITDISGVPTSGGLRPRIYYRKGAGSWFSQAGNLSSGTATNGQWSFTIVAADMGGLATGDIVSYYVIAQDIVGTPNISSNAFGAVATDVNTVTTPPVSPLTFTVNGVSLSGTYNVGTGQTYTTLTAAVAAYNSACLGGPVTFLLTDANYSASETFPITINANASASSTNTLTIKPTLAGTNISGTNASSLIILNGADYVTINGSISATSNSVCPPSSASRDLTITNTNVGTSTSVIWLQSTAANDAATNNNVINCNIIGSGNTQTLFGIGSGSSTIAITSLGVGNNFDSYINNNISKTQFGIFSQGSSIGFKNQGTVINQNLINTVAPNNVRRAGIMVGFENNLIISGNNISEIQSASSSEDVFGIDLGATGAAISTSAFTGNEVTNAIVTKNVIGSVRQTATYSAAGIMVVPAISGTNLIANNMISGVSSNGTSGDFSVGLLLGGGVGSTTQVYYNTVTMTSVPANTGASDKSIAVAIAGPNPIVDLRNNIFVNTQNNGSGNNYAIVYGYGPWSNLTSDHNDYYVAAGSTFFIGGTASLSSPTSYATVANLQSVTGKDGFAQNVLPNFVSATDLHLQTDNNCSLDGAGVAVSVSDDIDCQSRINYDLGADEFISTFALIITNPAGVCAPGTVDITAPAVTSGSTAGVILTYWSDPAATISLANPNAVSVSGTYYIKAVKGSCSVVQPVIVTINPIPTVNGVGNQVVCNGASTAIVTFTGTPAGTVFNWTNNNTSIGLAASGTGNIASFVASNAGTSPVTATISVTPAYTGAGTTCTGSSTSFTITVNPTPTVSAVSNQIVCNGSPTTAVTFSGSVSGTVFNWTNNNTSIGLGANGTGNIASFSGVNLSAVPVIATITVTPSYTNAGQTCTGTPITFNITVNPTPVLSGSITQPSTCVSADGAINLTVSGTPGPYTYNWSTVGGSGLVNGVEDQSGLTIGQYSVVVTAANGCTSTTVFNLIGPGGCSVCPLVGALSTTPSPAVCAGSNLTLNATSLAFMGVTYGITFKYSSTVLADPYTGGTVLGTVSNGSLGGGGTTASLNSNIPAAGNFYVYAILSPTPIDPSCRPYAQATITVNPVPGVNPIGSQTFCNTTPVPTGTFNFSSNVPGTFNGKILIAYADVSGAPTVLQNNLLALPGVSQVDLFDANAGTPTLAQMQGYGIVVPFSNSPYADPVALGNNLADYVDANGIVVGLGFTFYISPFGPTGRWATGNYSPYTATSNLDFAPHTLGTYNAGHPLMAGVTTLNSNYHNIVPTAAGATEVAQWDNGNSLVAFKGRVVGITAYIGQAATWSGDFAKVIVNAGNWLGGGGTISFNWTNNNTTIGLGANGTGNSLPAFTATNAGNAPVTATISVTASYTYGGATCTGSPATFNITVNPTPNVNAVSNQTVCNGAPTTPVNFSGNVAGTVYSWTNNTPSIGLAASGTGNIGSFNAINAGTTPVVATITVIPSYTNGGTTCTGAPVTFTITVNPTPNAVATPSSQTICSGSAITTIALSGAVSGTTYTWVRNNTVSVTGIGASGSGNISGTLTNTTNAPVTVTFTITPSANGCAGPTTTATVLVNPTPNAVATPASQTICSGSAMTTIVLSGNVTGTTYSWTRTNTVNVTGIPNSGTGNISGTPINNTTSQQTVTYTITPSANGCPGTPITATLIVNVGPTVTCPANITVNAAAGTCGAIVNYPPATATGSPAPIITYSQASGTLFPVGVTTVTVTATNSCGVATCTFTVTVVDNQPPTIICPANITVNNAPGVCGANVTYPFPTVSDNCTLPGGTPVSLTQTVNNTTITPIQIGCQYAGGTTAENSWWRAYNLAPLNLPAGITIRSVRFGIEKITGTTVPITARIWISNGTFPTATRTLVATQTANFGVQTGTFGVINFTTPAAVSPTAIVVVELYCPDQLATGAGFFIGSNGLGESAPSYLSAPACGAIAPTPIGDLVPGINDHIILNINAEYYINAPTLVQIAGIASGGLFPVGVTTNTFRATDAAGNTSTCSFTVTVVDAQAPSITCPANIVRNTDPGLCTASVVVPNPVFSDNCAVTQLTWAMTGATVASSPATGINFVGTRTFNLNGTTGQGITTITYTARDAAGNITTCSFTVTINDGVLPVINTQPATRFTCAGTNAVFTVGATAAGGPIAYQWQEWNGTAWANIAGATANSFTVNAVTFADNTRSFRVILTGLCSVVNSIAATLYVNPLPTISLVPSIPPVLQPAQSLNITAVASPTGGSYAWYYNGNLSATHTGAVWTGITVDGIGTYRVTYTDPNGCVNTSADLVVSGQQSDGLWVYPNPNTGRFTVRFFNALNESITINVYDAKGARIYQKVAATGTPYTGVDVDLGTAVAAGVYIVQVTNGSGKIIGARRVVIRHP